MVNIDEQGSGSLIEGLIWFFDHAETISDENIARVTALGGGIAIQNRLAFQGEIFVRRYGKKAAGSSPPIKRMISSGMPVGLGTDGTRVASYNPWVSIYWAVSGKTVGGTTVLGEYNRLTRTQALELFSSGVYQLIKEDKSKGKIKINYFADLTILDEDYFTIPEEKIASMRSALTIVNGKVVYASSQFKTVQPPPLIVIPAWSPVKYFNFKN